MLGVRATAARLAQPWLPIAALGYAAAAVVAVPRGAVPLRTYAGASGSAHILDLTAGLALLAAGSLAWVQPRLRGTALLGTLAGVAWFAPDWEGWEDGPTIVRSLGAVASPLFLALVFHLALGFPSGRIRGRPARLAVAAVYTAAGAVSVGWALFRDPFADPGCWRYCGANTFLVHADAGLALGLRDFWLRAGVAIGVLLATVAGLRVYRAEQGERRRLLPVLGPAAFLGLAEAAYAGALLHTRFENPRVGQFESVFLVRSLAATAVAFGVGRTVLEARRARTAVSRLAAELGAAPLPGTLAERLAVTLGDSRLEVAYWLPNLRRYVDGHGRLVDPPVSSNGRAATPIVRGGDLVAVVVHEPALLDADRLETEIGASARLAVDNERLHAEVAARLGDLRESRARIVQIADAERRRLERDLHDGAQQRLLALSFDLRLAAAAARDSGNADAAHLLVGAVDETQTALDELRDLARGIYPAILTEAGLGSALATLADTTPIAVMLTCPADKRYHPSVETTAYVAVVEAVDDAAGRSSSFAAVEIRQDGDSLIVVVEDDGRPRTSPMTHVADRIGARGGELEVGPRILRAEIPCA